MEHVLAFSKFVISHISPSAKYDQKEEGEEEEEPSLSSSSSSTGSYVDVDENINVNNDDSDENGFNQNNEVIMEDAFLLVDLPDEVVLYIFTFIDAKYISGSLQFVNWRLNILCQENRLWKKICNKSWNVKEKRIKLNWRSYHLLKTHLQSEGSVEWMKIPPIGSRPSRRYQNTSTTVGSKIYLVGGQQSALNRFNDIFEFDTETYTFMQVEVKGPSQPPSFARHIAVAIGKKIWVHGGYDGHGTYFGVSVFDVEESTWTYVETTGDKPSARTNHAAAAIGNNIYIYGGIKRSTHDDSMLEDLGDMYVLNTETLEWHQEICTNMPPPRCGHKMLALRGKLYLFGGGAGEDWATTYNDISVYDPETKAWTLIEATGFPDTSTFSCMFALDPFLFVFGGQCKKEKVCSQVVYCYDTITHSWVVAQPSGATKPEARDMATMSVCGHSAFLFGGYNQKCFDDVYLFRLTNAANRALKELMLPDETLASPSSSSPPSSPVPSSSSSRSCTTERRKKKEEEIGVEDEEWA